MTEGRFESKVHCAPMHRDGLAHWASHNRAVDYPFRKWDPETRQKESCPFHDLRAEGQFQPEIHNPDVTGNVNDSYFHRNQGKRMNCKLDRGPAQGCGGVPLAVDTAPNANTGKCRGDKPWTSTVKNDLFSRLPYQPLGPPPLPGSVPPSSRHFSTGRLPEKVAPYEHMNNSPVPLKPPPPFRLKCGKGGGLFDSNTHKGPRAVTAPTEKKKQKVTIGRQCTNLRKNIQNTFGPYPTYMSPTYPPDEGRKEVKRKLKPIYTWSTKTKRTMPISAPWACTKVGGVTV
eukprot:TRINITY_DN8300_c0_g1_i1.p1 TRINITY_DN8300_c0_g1~~TRINITY_DN8300_c0_g1_i1.p1  ORF type:complete len:286 (+),score=21.00 TRINITY_DN8300_c0_g1_i1:41-898(+)